MALTKVKDLKAKQGNVDIELDVLDVGQAREFQKFGKPGRVSTALAKDETGDIKITLWNDEIDSIKAGDRIKITNGYISEWQGDLQVSTGRFGKIEIIGESKSSKAQSHAPNHTPKEEATERIDDEEDVI